MNGMSPTIRALVAPLATARVWWSISSIVTGSVVEYPRTFWASESPTRMTGTPASSRILAVGKSYAVSMMNRSPRSLNLRRSRMVNDMGLAPPFTECTALRQEVYPGSGRIRQDTGAPKVPSDVRPLDRQTPQGIFYGSHERPRPDPVRVKPELGGQPVDEAARD